MRFSEMFADRYREQIYAVHGADVYIFETTTLCRIIAMGADVDL